MKIMVGLWSRPKTVKSATTGQTLAGLRESLKETTARANASGIRKGPGRISSETGNVDIGGGKVRFYEIEVPG